MGELAAVCGADFFFTEGLNEFFEAVISVEQYVLGKKDNDVNIPRHIGNTPLTGAAVIKILTSDIQDLETIGLSMDFGMVGRG